MYTAIQPGYSTIEDYLSAGEERLIGALNLHPGQYNEVMDIFGERPGYATALALRYKMQDAASAAAGWLEQILNDQTNPQDGLYYVKNNGRGGNPPTIKMPRNGHAGNGFGSGSKRPSRGPWNVLQQWWNKFNRNHNHYSNR